MPFRFACNRLQLHTHTKSAVIAASPFARIVQNCRRSQSNWTWSRATPETSSLVAACEDGLDDIKAKNMDLRARLKTLHWPPLTSFQAHGQTYDLPFRGGRLPKCAVTLPADARLRYLAGFFDGDGCVSCEQSLSGCRLSITQSINQAGVLLLFVNMFGGAVYRQSDGLGLCRPTVRWELGGVQACHAACRLAPHSITKQKQLLLASAWPTGSLQRQCCKQQLDSLKRHDSAAADTCTMEYLTGFFDAEGHLQHSGQASLTVFIAQKYPTVLQCLKDFLAHDLRIDARLRVYKSNCLLYICRTAASKQLLHSMMQAGLFCKAKQAELALSLSRRNASQVRAAMAQLVGNQRFGQKLAEDGVRRSQQINAAQRQAAKLTQAGQFVMAEAKMREIETLRQEHMLLNARFENKQLHDCMLKLQDMHCPASGA